MATLTIDDLRYYYYGGGSQAEMDFMQQCYDAGISAADVLAGGGGGGGTTILVKDEGSVTGPAVGTINFTGNAVTATNAAGTATVNVTGGQPSGTAGGSLTGSYPNPTLAANSVTGTELNALAVTTAKLNNQAVTNIKLAIGANNTVKGNLSGTNADLTGTDLATVLASTSGGGTANFLRADGSWQAPAGGGGSPVAIADEGSTLTATVASINFTGAGVTATNTGTAVTVNIPTGGSPAASSVTFTPTTTLSSTNVQSAIAELEADVIGLPTLTTSDTLKVPVLTASGVTTINVNNLISQTSLVSSDTSKLTVSTASGITTLTPSANLMTSPVVDTSFEVQNTGDATKKFKFDAANVPTATTRTLAIPVTTANDSLVLQDTAQVLTSKSLSGPNLQTITTAGGPGVTFRHANDTNFNDYSRTSAIEMLGNPTLPARFCYMHQGNAVPGANGQTANGSTLGQIIFRGHTGSAFSSGNHVAINAIAEEAVTAAARGTRLTLSVTPLTTTTAVEALRLNTDAVPSGLFRGAVVVGAGSAMAAPASTYALEVKTDALGYGVGAGGSAAQGTSRVTGVTVNKPSGAVTMFSAPGSATPSSFVVTNSYVGANDVVVLSNRTATANVYLFYVLAVAAGSFTIGFQTTGGTATDQPVINFQVHKGVIT